jgi:hypothetical protein
MPTELRRTAASFGLVRVNATQRLTRSESYGRLDPTGKNGVLSATVGKNYLPLMIQSYDDVGKSV